MALTQRAYKEQPEAWSVSRSGLPALFQLRLVIWYFSFPYPALLFAVTAAHGFEYLFITRKMLKNSSMKKDLVSVGALVAVGLVAYPSLRFIFNNYVGEPTVLVLIMMGLCQTLSYLHYYLDGVVFRFSDPEIRETVGPLLG